ncbi:hypothetical protein BS78_02G188500 [Paspalum vaginatum]|nr:hypothetical protein BS78_02G188500 [Paspalum vaginatum]
MKAGFQATLTVINHLSWIQGFKRISSSRDFPLQRSIYYYIEPGVRLKYLRVNCNRHYRSTVYSWIGTHAQYDRCTVTTCYNVFRWQGRIFWFLFLEKEALLSFQE